MNAAETHETVHWESGMRYQIGTERPDPRSDLASLAVCPVQHHPSVLIRGPRIGELSRDELAGFVEGAWLSHAGPRAFGKWMKEHGTSAEQARFRPSAW